MPTLWDLLDNNKIGRFEGEKGVENLNKVAKLLGYDESNFKYGSALETFLADNPGAMEAILEWIDNNANCWPNVLGDDEDEDE